MVDATHELVGRGNELAEIEVALDQLAAGRSWLLQIAGEPGIGKSRLLAELCRRAEDLGYLVLDGRAAEFEHDIPFGLIVDALNDYLGSLEPALWRAAVAMPLYQDADVLAVRGEVTGVTAGAGFAGPFAGAAFWNRTSG